MDTEHRDDRAGFLDSWTALIRRRWRAGAGVFLAILGLSLAIVFLTHPVYRADSRLRLGEPPPMSGVSPGAGLLGFFRLGGDPFSNDLELLASRTLTEGVVRDVGLNATLKAPRGWHRDSLFASFAAGATTGRATFRLRWERDGRITVRRTAPEDSLIGDFAPGQDLSFGGVRLTPLEWRPGMPREVDVRTLPFDEAVRLARERISLERPSREANVVEISYRGSDPAVTRAVVESVVARFVELRTAIQRRESGQTVDSLRTVAHQTLAELGSAEAAMEALQRTTQLVAPDAQNEAFIERYSEILGQLESARAELAASGSLLSRVDAAPSRAQVWTDLAAYPAFLQNETVGELLSGLTRLEEQRAELASRRTVENREHQVLLEQIQRRDASLRSIAQAYHTALRERVGLLEGQAREMETVLERVPAQAIELGRRQRSVRLLSEVLVLTEQRLRQEELRQALTFANVQVIDPPALQYRPVWPRKKLGLGAGFLLASLFGALALVVVERADRTVRRAGEVREIIGAPVLAVAVPNGAGAISLSSHEIRAILGRRGPEHRNGSGLALVPVGDASGTDAVAAALAGGANGAEGNGGARPPVRVMAPASSFAAAVAATEEAPVVLMVVCGRTGRDELHRTAALFRQTGGAILGAIVICARSGEADHVWK